MQVFLGIDGGGTKTTFALMNEEGRLLAKTVSETIHFKQIGLSAAKNRISDGIDEVLAQAGVAKESIVSCFAAIPGYGEFPELITEMQKFFPTILSEQTNFFLGNDCVAGYAGSLKAEEGVNLVLGTGAIAYGQDNFGNEARSSGWGPFCGDEGSAYALGQACIRIFAKEADGRLDGKILYNLLKEELNLSSDFSLIDIVHKEWNLDRTKIANLAKLLGKAAREGDQPACEAIKEAAYEGFIAVKAVVEQLKLSEKPIKVSYSGGVFKLGETILTPFIELCQREGYEVIPPLLSPLEGSLVMAVKKSKLPEEKIQKIINEIKPFEE